MTSEEKKTLFDRIDEKLKELEGVEVSRFYSEPECRGHITLSTKTDIKGRRKAIEIMQENGYRFLTGGENGEMIMLEFNKADEN